MALNWQTFRTRALTALIFVVVMLAGLLWNQWSFFLLFSVIHFGCWWEYLKLTEKIYQATLHIYIKLGFMLLGYAFLCWFCGPEYQLGGYGLKENLPIPLSIAGFILVVLGIFRNSVIHVAAFGMALVGLAYISLSWGMMMNLTFYVDHHFRSLGIEYSGESVPVLFALIPVITIASIWINDTMAYMVGSLIGRTPFSKISPKKTWEGTLGGIILAVAVVGLLAMQFVPDQFVLPGFVLQLEHHHWFVIAGIAAVTGTIGDLLESKLKRMAGVKDSGRFMPGHGGFMDRFDSLLLATPFVWAYVQLFMF